MNKANEFEYPWVAGEYEETHSWAKLLANEPLHRVVKSWAEWPGAPKLNLFGKPYDKREYMIDLADTIEIALNRWLKLDQRRRLTVAKQHTQLVRLSQAADQFIGILNDNQLRDKLIRARKRHSADSDQPVKRLDLMRFEADGKAAERIAHDLKCYIADFEAALPHSKAEQLREQRLGYRKSMALINAAVFVWRVGLEQPFQNEKPVFTAAFHCLFDQLRTLAYLPKVTLAERKRLLRIYKERESRRKSTPRL
jgi:hypothetical protein